MVRTLSIEDDVDDGLPQDLTKRGGSLLRVERALPRRRSIGRASRRIRTSASPGCDRRIVASRVRTLLPPLSGWPSASPDERRSLPIALYTAGLSERETFVASSPG